DSFPTQQQSLHRYACARCRLKKVKCNKVIPTCIYCLESGVQCTYLARRPRNSQNLHHKSTPLVRRPLLAAGESKIDHEFQDEVRSDGEDDEDLVIPREMRNSIFETRSDSRQSEQGRLFVGQGGKSRYINSDKAKQVASLESILAKTNASKEETSAPYPPCSLYSLGSSSLFGTTCAKTSLQSYHPSPKVMGVLWEYYVHNIDVLIKITYKPAAEALVLSAAQNLETRSPAVEAFLFAIWFATVTAMSTEECLSLLKEQRNTLLVKYQYALEQALAQTGWMTTQEVLVLQAFSLYLGFKLWKDSRSLWMLSGIALGNAQAMGMHSDSVSFRLDTIESEVRRRVWWWLCQLDLHISENCGLEPHVPMVTDTKLPLHINDSDLTSGSADSIVPRAEFTEMTPSLVKMELSETRLKIKRLECGSSSLSVGAIENLVEEQIRRYEETYLTFTDDSSYLGHLCHLGVRIIIARLWKIRYDATEKKNDTAPGELKVGLIMYNTHVLEILHQFPERNGQFGWFFRCKHTQWLAMAYLLIELCKAPQGPVIDRAWAILDVVFGTSTKDSTEDAVKPTSVHEQTIKSVLWQPMLKLHKQARYAREQALKLDTQSGSSHSSIDLEYDTTTTSPAEQQSSKPQQAPYEEGLLGDPFLGPGIDCSEGMSWEQLDTWLQSFQPELLNLDECIDNQTNDWDSWM
ncbi:hypothetical protein K505DRAFT_99337, partial [Melanomma pulvis-pyrius CBS 109.77]